MAIASNAFAKKGNLKSLATKCTTKERETGYFRSQNEQHSIAKRNTNKRLQDLAFLATACGPSRDGM